MGLQAGKARATRMAPAGAEGGATKMVQAGAKVCRAEGAEAIRAEGVKASRLYLPGEATEVEGEEAMTHG